MIRLDLRVRKYAMQVGLVNPTPFGCADCGLWFQFAGELVEHMTSGECTAAQS